MILTKVDETIEEHLRRIEINPEVLMKIIQWKKDAEKYNNLMKANSQLVQDNIKYSAIFPIIKRLKKEQKKNQELLDELIEEEKTGFVSEEYKQSLEDCAKFFQKILENKE